MGVRRGNMYVERDFGVVTSAGVAKKAMAASCGTGATVLLFLMLLFLLLLPVSRAQVAGFLSLDCGGNENYTDDIGLRWTADGMMKFGNKSSVSVPGEKRRQYMSVRYFPADDRKYCYTLPVTLGIRFLIRASFLYGNFDNSTNNVIPKFDISLGATRWSTIVILDPNAVIFKEMVFVATSPTVSVCLYNSDVGTPFISTLELRPFNGSMYYSLFEKNSYLQLGTRINFGAETNESLRYPDDPFDRIWTSDSLKLPDYLVDVAPGTTKIATNKSIFVDYHERPPEKVMQTAVVGERGELTYRLNLDDFPAGKAWLAGYMAEIEDFPANESRKFKVYVPDLPVLSVPTLNIEENAGGKYRVYEPGFNNYSLPLTLSFALRQAENSTRGPILNALEIYKYLPMNLGSPDAAAMSNLSARYLQNTWALEGGDPCVPAPWTWVKCSSDPQPLVISIILSGKNLTGNIPSEITTLACLTELRLDGNSFSGPIPDLSSCQNLQYIHLEDNELTGPISSSLADLPNLRELYVQNNNLSGGIPSRLLSTSITFNYSGNAGLHKENKSSKRVVIAVCCAIGLVLLIGCAVGFYYWRRKKKNTSIDVFSTAKSANKYPLKDIEVATDNFADRVGFGGFGTVYRGKLADGQDIAVKVLINESDEGTMTFANEVELLSKIHHRNLVRLLGYSQKDQKYILVYEFMHKGTLKDRLHGPVSERVTRWAKRLEIAEDAAKGIEYLHTGCSPAIVHRDLKTTNILLDENMRAKVSDFGLSKLVDDSHVSSTVRGTLGYLDPEYYSNNHATIKCDVYSFGIILLELVSGQDPISSKNFGADCFHIVEWVRSHISKGDINAVVDPSLEGEYDIQSVWMIVETALACCKPNGSSRPTMSEVLKEIEAANAVQRNCDSTGSFSKFSSSSDNIYTPQPRVG